jgi:hypothetical protein
MIGKRNCMFELTLNNGQLLGPNYDGPDHDIQTTTCLLPMKYSNYRVAGFNVDLVAAGEF